MFEQAAIAVRDEKGFAELSAKIDAAFSAQDVDVFLSRAVRKKIRIRDLEGILRQGLLGREAAGIYASLPASDQGLTRERYLTRVETVSRELRERYFKAYALY